MKLLYITNGINGSGGLERVLSVKVSMLAEKFGYEVSVMVLNQTHQNPFYEFSSKIKFYSIEVGGNPLRYWESYKNGIQKTVDTINPDVIAVCDDGLKAFFVPTFLKTNAKIIYERHVSKLIEARAGQGTVKKFITKLKWFLMGKFGARFSKFIVLTEGNKNEWPTLKNVEVISNPLSFYPDKTAVLENKTVICVGKIAYQKGQDLLVKAWEKVIQKYPDWKLELYGKANENFLKTDHLKEKNIYFFPPQKNIADRYLDSSVCVMSSRFEGFGMVLIEAMACGVPCVSFDCDYGPGDIIEDGEDGFLVEKENTDDLAEKLMLLIENEAMRKRFGINAKENVKRFLPENILLKWDDLFKSLVK